MDWINLRIADLRSDPYLDTPPAGRSTWLAVLAFCHEQENGGIIGGAEAWADRRWLQACGVTRREVLQAPRLLHFEAGNLHVEGYPIEKQWQVEAKRLAGKKGGVNRWAKVRAASATGSTSANGSADSTATSTWHGTATRSAYTEVEGEVEGEVERKKETEPPNPPPPARQRAAEGEGLKLSELMMGASDRLEHPGILTETARQILTLMARGQDSAKKRGRRLSHESEAALARQIEALPLSPEQWANLAWWLALPEIPDDPFLGPNKRPRDADRLAQRLFSELERAENHALQKKKKDRADEPEAPAGWQDAALKLWPQAVLPASFWSFDADERARVLAFLDGEK